MFKKAERKKAKLRLGIAGTSGSGKTWSSLEIAKGMGGKIAMIDTESGRGELYGEDFDYDVLRLESPYSPEKYIAAIKDAETHGYDTLIIDSLSHAWAGEGGILSIVDKAGATFTSGWKVGTPKQNALVDAIITSKLHVIITLRTKTEYVIEKNDKGKNEPRKIGMAPIQRDGLEYEFTVFMDMSNDHIAHVTKDNTKLFDQQFLKPTSDMGAKLIEWLNSGKSAEEIEKQSLNQAIDSILHAENLETLKSTFNDAKKHYSSNTELFNEIIAHKDKRKAYLLNRAVQ